MKSLIVYDSIYGNTEKIARAITGALGNDVRVLHPGEMNPSELKSIDIFIVGSPTLGGRPTQAIRECLNKITKASLEGIKVAAFDTRISTKFVGVFGYAAGRIARDLKAKGGNLVVPPEGFFVTGVKGPLNEGELERAGGWLKEIVKGTN